MAQFYQYDPRLVSISWGAILLYGFAGDAFIKVARNEDSFKLDVGGHGDATRVSMTNRSGKVTAKLLAASPCNDSLSTANVADELFGASVAPLFVKDLQGTTLVEAESAWLMKPAEIEFGTDGGEREWVFEAPELLIFGGGSLR